MKRQPLTKFKTYKSDAAPFFFFIDIFPLENSVLPQTRLSALVDSIKNNPIMPLPMRVDRVFNGESSVLIRPREIIFFPVTDECIALINPTPFLQFGLEKLIFFAEIRASEQLYLSVRAENVSKWWNKTKFLYGNLFRVEEDFSEFLRAYLHTIIKANINGDDPVTAAKQYCQLVADVCQNRLEKNLIQTDIRGEQKNAKMYRKKDLTYYKNFKKIKELKYHPELVDIEIFELSEQGFSKEEDNRILLVNQRESNVIKYLPILFYDDLQECMLQNLKRLDDNPDELLNPSYLLEQKIIILHESKDENNEYLHNFSWWSDFNNINIKSIFRSLLSEGSKK